MNRRARAALAAAALIVTVGAAALSRPGFAHLSFYQLPESLTPSTSSSAPATPDSRRTTHSAVYLGNLDGRIRSLRRRADPERRLDLARLLAYRARLLASTEDAEAAEELCRRLLRHTPALAGAWLLRAELAMRTHRFDAARRSLETAARHGADENVLQGLRLQLDTALGRDVYPALRRRAALRPSLYSLADLANALLDRGQPDAAEALFARAERLYRDSSPTALAWLHVQQGVGYLRYRRPHRALVYFRAAYQRFPEYALAREHLAYIYLALDQPAVALTLLLYQRPLPRTPSYHGALALSWERLGKAADADAAHAAAETAYRRALRRHPAAWAQHAAEYHLARGRHRQALTLARDNAALRQDQASLLLLARAELVVGRRDAACRAWLLAAAAGSAAPEITRWRARFARCPPARSR